MKTIIMHYRGSIKVKDGITPLKARDIVYALQKYHGEFIIVVGNKHIDMRSILGLVSLALREGDQIELYMNVDYEKYQEVTDFLQQYIHISVKGNLDTPYEEPETNEQGN